MVTLEPGDYWRLRYVNESALKARAEVTACQAALRLAEAELARATEVRRAACDEMPDLNLTETSYAWDDDALTLTPRG